MGFTETAYARFLDAARQQLHGPVVLVRDNMNTHVSRAMRQLTRPVSGSGEVFTFRPDLGLCRLVEGLPTG